MKGEPILAERGVDAEIRRAILSHANYSGVTRESQLEKTLFACDELAGFLTAVRLRQTEPQHRRSGSEVGAQEDEGQGVRARSVSREDIVNGAQELGVDLDEHIAFCIEAMKDRAADLGL